MKLIYVKLHHDERGFGCGQYGTDSGNGVRISTGYHNGDGWGDGAGDRGNGESGPGNVFMGLDGRRMTVMKL